jgi:hypothetical protein
MRAWPESGVTYGYLVAVFLGACLLFIVEPMFGKMVLPFLGGSPAVWITCMLFFQCALLLGYLYAHFAPRWLGVRRHIAVHLGLLLLALLFLPITVTQPGEALRQNHPTAWLLLALGLSLGVPFVLLSSTGPLLQTWFFHSTHRQAHDPYFLYAASNTGSLLALLSYPFLLEATLPLQEQAKLWRWGYIAFIVLVAISAAFVRRRISYREDSAGIDPGSVDRRTIVRWTMLAFVPSSFLLALTTHVTTDMAAVPLLWIVPLVLYLLSFTMVFGRRTSVSQRVLVRWQPVGLICLSVLEFWGQSASSPWLLPLHLIVFFVTALVCHGALAATKPAAARLTTFYICIAVGGALGGIFNALVAPALFDSVLEYPLTLLLACAVRPRSHEQTHAWPSRWDAILIAGAFLVLVLTRIISGNKPTPAAAIIASAVAAMICLRMSRDSVRLTAAIAAVVIAGVLADTARGDVVLRERNFFGVREVREDTAKNMHVLMHGTTKHGAQSMNPAQRREPISYYNRQGPLGDIFHQASALSSRNIAIVGLGTGGMTAYARPHERWTFFEIDPGIDRLAHDPRYFTYLQDTPAQVEVALGDGRLSLSTAPDRSYDLIVLDAFSSDAIPTHLLTFEALAIYRRKLTDQGILVFHLSNRYLDLEPVLARLIEASSVSGLIRVNTARTRQLLASDGDPSIWAAVAERASTLGGLQNDQRWRPLQTRGDVALWTDNFSNIFSVLRRPGK